jgi:hypothetical protein
MDLRATKGVASRFGRFLRHAFGEKEKNEICSEAMGAALDLIEQFLTAQVP